MKAGFRILIVFAVCIAVAPDVSAQWPKYPDQNVPRKADGSIDMDAPTPRMPDGKPDLSGTWENVGRGPGRLPKQDLSLDEKPYATFNDVGAGFKDGLPFLPAAKALRDQRRARNSADNPDVWCLPMGNMQFNVHPFPRKMVQTPGLLIIMYESHQGLRQVFLDGRTIPPDDPNPTFFGYSVGRWEGETLVVETAGFRDGQWLDIIGSPLSDAGRTIERFTRTKTGQLEVEVTFEDKKSYTRPFTVRLTQRLMADDEIFEMVCLENNRSVEHLAPDTGAKPEVSPIFTPQK
jgi:hypothetical protein